MQHVVDAWHRQPNWMRATVILGLLLLIIISGRPRYLCMAAIPSCLESTSTMRPTKVWFTFIATVLISIILRNDKFW